MEPDHSPAFPRLDFNRRRIAQLETAVVALSECLEEAADWLDADLAHAPDTPTAMADRELVQRWRAALERAV